MASTPKSGSNISGTRSTRTQKPATIDLDAKEVGGTTAETAKSSANKPAVPAAGADTITSKEGASKEAASTSGTAETKSPEKSGPEIADAKKPPHQEEAKKAASSGSAATGSTPPPAAPAKSGGGVVSALMGAAMAVVGLGAVGQVENANEIPLIGALYGGGDAAENGDGSAINTEIDALKQQIVGLSQNGENATVDLTPLETKLAAVEDRLNNLPAQASSAGPDPQLAERLAALETSMQEIAARPVATGDGAVSLAPVQSAIDELTRKVAALESASAANDIEAISGQLPEITASIEALGQTVTELGEQVSGLAKRTDDISLVVKDNAEGLAALNSQSETLTETVASVKANEKVARSVAVNAIASALSNDDPLGLPLASMKALIGETPETTRLSELAEQGVPARKALLSGLDAFTNSVKNPDAPGKDASLSEKFWANAQSLVTFRSTGPREGDDAFAILSRVRANVEADSLDNAKGEWAKLPTEIRQQGEDWLRQLDLRVEAFALKEAITEKLAAEAG